MVTTSTDETGSYVFAGLSPGRWRFEAEITGFKPAAREIEVTPEPVRTDFDLELLPAPAPPPVRLGMAARAAAFQRLQLSQAAMNEVQTALNAPRSEPPSQEMSENANESFLVSGSLSRGLQSPQMMDGIFGPPPGGPMGPGMAGLRGPEAGMAGQQGQQEGMGAAAVGPPGRGPQMGGGLPGRPGGGGAFGGPGGAFGGPGGGFGGLGGPGGARGPGGRPMLGAAREASVFGNRRGRGREGFRGGGFFSLSNSALDAKPYSLNGQEAAKPSYARNRFGLLGGGVLHIPKLLTDDNTFFFASYFGTRSRNPFDSIATMPSPAERAGDFSQSVIRGPVTVFDPQTGSPFPGNRIPASRIDPAAQTMLSLIPLPNQPGDVRNYRLVTSVPQNTDNFSLRMNRGARRKDRFSGSFNLQRRAGDAAQLYGFRDASSGQGLSLDITWTHNLAAGIISNLRGSFSRNTARTLPFFAYGTDWAGLVGIRGTSGDPRNYGPPNLSFTNFGSLNDASHSNQANQTAGLSEGFIVTRGKHTFTFGAEYRRTQVNSLSDQNARGTYVFSGLATSGFDAAGNPLPGTGFDFADYLLGAPQTASIRFGSSDIYLRGAAFSSWAQQDWRLRSNLTINAGLRYEYQRPVTEKYGRMANLDIAPGFMAVQVVTPASPGAYSGAFPAGLVDPDRNNLAPRFGVAWKPSSRHQALIRAGYGWYFNGSVYGSIAARLAQQPPFAKSNSINTSTARPLTIADGFVAGASKLVNNTFAIDRAYRIGYAQTWSLSVQQDLPWSLVGEIGYLGTKGTRLDMQRLPNRAAPGSPLTSEQRRRIADASGFILESSEGSSIYHAGQFRLTRRFRQGLSANALYTWSKSIDNASSFGSGGAVVAQDDQNLAAERGLSSFDRRHDLRLFYLYTTSAGRGGGAPHRLLLRDWQLSGGVSVRSGGPLTASVLGNRSDAGGSGALGSARADATGLPVSASGFLVNPLAFALPPSGRYGNAARNTIPTPMLFAVNMSLGRSIRIGEGRRAVDLRLEADNLLNDVTITRIGTTVNSSNFGAALGAASMRTLRADLRFRF